MEPSANWEAQLVNLAAGGDSAALGALLARYGSKLVNDLKFEIGPQLNELYTADDAAQDACDYVLRNFTQFEYRGDGSFYGWLKRIAKNRAIDAARAQAADKRGGQAHRVRVNDEQATRFANSVDALRHDSGTPSRQVVRVERAQAVRVALLQLNDKEREVVTLKFFNGLDWSEVASRLGNTVASARSLAHRAFDKLEAVLASMSRYLSQG